MVEQAFQAKEYLEQGYQNVTAWLDNIEQALVTKTAQEMFAELKNRSCTAWTKEMK